MPEASSLNRPSRRAGSGLARSIAADSVVMRAEGAGPG
jgi:hypothetical protein